MDSAALPRRRKGSAQHESFLSEDAYEGDARQQRDRQHGTTIRAVTPESIPEDAVAYSSREGRVVSSPPLSPRTTSAARDNPRPRGFVARSNSGESEYSVSSVRSMRDAQTRPRTRTMEERTLRDRSPGTLFMTGRHRIGSVHATGSPTYHGLEEALTSIGHPSTVPIPPTPQIPNPNRNSTTGRRLVKQQPQHHHQQQQQQKQQQQQPQQQTVRTASPIPHSSPASQADSWVSPVPASDARKVFRLMRSTCGRMQGMLAFRRGESNQWSLSYCYINEETGSLVYEGKQDNTYHKTLIPDLRGCRVKTAYDAETLTAYIDVISSKSNLEVHLRPPTQEEFDSWFAALLCWQPIRPKGIHNKMAKPQSSIVSERRLVDSRRHSEVSLLKEAPIIKVGKMIYWDTNVSYTGTGVKSSARPPMYRIQSYGSRRWRRVSCTLRENGELKLYSDTDVTLVSVVQLSQLSRCAVQRLDPSVLDNDFCIAIYPQYTSTSISMSLLRPIFLSLESRVLYEVWIVLLRAFTIPQLYGPKMPAMGEDLSASQTFAAATQDMFRMERWLYVKVSEARMLPPMSPKFETTPGNRPLSGSASANLGGGYYVELLLDGETRARTLVKNEGNSPFWREEFEFTDLPAVLSTASLVLKKRPPSQTLIDRQSQQDKVTQDAFTSPDGSGGYSGINFDQTVGKCDVYLDDLGEPQEVEKWWPLANMYGNSVGEVLVKVRAQEGVILMARDYQPMSELLHRFSNGLTLQIAQMIPNELKKLSECLLNIFQVSGQASEWIMAMIEEEIDGTLKETPASRLRFSRRLGSSESNDSFGSSSDRELFVRDMGNTAKLEANLLFRGNTLLTKSLDLHMKRLGKEYLEDTLAEKLKELCEKDPDCEVDPNRVSSQHELDRNWRRLINLTEEMWNLIYQSTSRCPSELRVIFRHVRACAEDRYGDFLRTVRYSSVSGFIFLRFFCPAVLNPKLFGLLKDHPKPRARRTLTLVAKSLQGLANMSTFGAKEHWMEPMNTFLTSHRQEFKTFIDNLCAISPTASIQSPIPPSYSTPLAILQRLPPTSREGFPSLPYLIDHAANFAALVELWLEHTKSIAGNIIESDGDLLKFHLLCQSLQKRTQESLNKAERAERPSSSLSINWEELVEQLENSNIQAPPAAHHSSQIKWADEEEAKSVADDDAAFERASERKTTLTQRELEFLRRQQEYQKHTSGATSAANSQTDEDAPLTMSSVSRASKLAKLHRDMPLVLPGSQRRQHHNNNDEISPSPTSGKHHPGTATPGSSRYATSTASIADDDDFDSHHAGDHGQETPPGSAGVWPHVPSSALSTTTTLSSGSAGEPHPHHPLNPTMALGREITGRTWGHEFSGPATRMASGTRSAGGRSIGSTGGASPLERDDDDSGDEYTTALPRFGEKEREREREREKEGRGIRNFVPFGKKGNGKGKEKG